MCLPHLQTHISLQFNLDSFPHIRDLISELLIRICFAKYYFQSCRSHPSNLQNQAAQRNPFHIFYNIFVSTVGRFIILANRQKTVQILLFGLFTKSLELCCYAHTAIHKRNIYETYESSWLIDFQNAKATESSELEKVCPEGGGVELRKDLLWTQERVKRAGAFHTFRRLL